MKTIKKMFTILLMVLVAVLGISLGVGFYLSAPGYDGPKSDHFNGTTFENQGDVQANGLPELLKWVTNRDKGEWHWVDAAPGAPPVDRVAGSAIRVTFVNHSTFLIQTDGLNILTDPIWSEHTSPVQFAGPKRMRPPGIRFEDLPPIDVILISHNHYDHLDLNTMKRLAEAHDPVIFTPLGVAAYLQKHLGDEVAEMDWWEEMPLPNNLRLTCVPAQHFSGRGMFDRDKTLWSGWVIKRKTGNIYFAGDTGYGPFFKDIGEKCAPIRLALIPIGAYQPEWFMSPIHISPKEAVQVHLDCKAQQSISMHFGTFPLADDGMHDPQNDLKKALSEQKLPEDRFLIMEEGKPVDFKP